MDGLLVVNKPVGWSSMDVVRRVRAAAGGGKVGHAGTLDPLADGVVVCCLGRATRRVEQIMGLPKTYRAGVDLSAFTRTDDRESVPEPVAVAHPPPPQTVEAALARFVGRIEQTPPAHSAMRVEGRRAYQLARAGQPVALTPRPVTIHRIAQIEYAWPIATLRIRCGRGTYIRSLARDLGRALGTGGHLARLCREAVGPFTLEQAVTVERCAEGLGPADLIEPASALDAPRSAP